MATLTINCPKCNKPAKIQSQFTAMNLVHYVYQCGHLEVKSESLEPYGSEEAKQSKEANIFETTLKELNKPSFNLSEELEIDRMISEGFMLPVGEIEPEFWAFDTCLPFYCKECGVSHTKKHGYLYQRHGVTFIEKSLPLYGGCLIADEMGLGKTIQANLFLRKHFKLMTPTLIVVKGSTILQWQDEIHEWVSDKLSACVAVTDRVHIIPGFKTYIMSMDLLGCKGVREAILKLGIKLIILDECQNFKDRDSLRTRSLIKIIKDCSVKPFILALSGTPIKNRLTEYFPILNLLDPRTFYSFAGFCKTWLYKNERGQYTRLDPTMSARFFEVTSKYILRRAKRDVLKDLPELIRDTQFIDIDDPAIKNSYNAEVDLLKNFLNTADKVDTVSLLGWFARMRAITGSAKAPYAVDWSQDFLESTEESLMIGIHHKAVRDTLYAVFTKRGFDPLKLSGEDNVYRKNDVQRAFNNGENRMLIINILAGGVGLNLQSCSNLLILELPWNPADLEQFIGRSHRNGQQNTVTATTLIARGTLDEFMYKLIYEKSVLSTEAGINIAPHANMDELMKDPAFLKEFAEFVANHKI